MYVGQLRLVAVLFGSWHVHQLGRNLHSLEQNFLHPVNDYLFPGLQAVFHHTQPAVPAAYVHIAARNGTVAIQNVNITTIRSVSSAFSSMVIACRATLTGISTRANWPGQI